MVISTGKPDRFNECLAFVLKWEGGYCNDRDDPGGETNFGINKRDHPNEDIKGMTVQRAGEIYRKQYWEVVGADKLPVPLDIIAFDAAVNCGPKRSRNWVTMGMGKVPPDTALMIEVRRAYYRQIASLHPPLKKFLRGWMNRVDDLEKFIRG